MPGANPVLLWPRRKVHASLPRKFPAKYWMYFGDTDLFMAVSDNLLHWSPIEEDGKLKSVLRPVKDILIAVWWKVVLTLR
jgi:hypothetical protein